jgi:hypothetical protein
MGDNQVTGSLDVALENDPSSLPRTRATSATNTGESLDYLPFENLRCSFSVALLFLDVGRVRDDTSGRNDTSVDQCTWYVVSGNPRDVCQEIIVEKGKLQGDKLYSDKPIFMLHTRETSNHVDGSSSTLGMHKIFDTHDEAIGCAGIVKDEHLTTLKTITKKILDKAPTPTLSLSLVDVGTRSTALHALECFIAAVDQVLGGVNGTSTTVLTAILKDLIPTTASRKFKDKWHPFLRLAKMFQNLVPLRLSPFAGAHRVVLCLKELMGFGDIYNSTMEDEDEAHCHRVVNIPSFDDDAQHRISAKFGRNASVIGKYTGKIKFMVAVSGVDCVGGDLTGSCKIWKREKQIGDLLRHQLCLIVV